MYCPLCKAEYRVGFDCCSDCLIGLVYTREEAETSAVTLLWKGVRQSTFDDIVDALRDANVPVCARSGKSVESGSPSLGVLALFSPSVRAVRLAQRFGEQMSWEILVLESDYAKARQVVGNQLAGGSD